VAVHELHEGGGLPIVLIHAFPLDHRMWIDAAAALPTGIRAVAVDLPGQGFSSLGRMEPEVDLVADAIHDTVAKMGIHNAVVVGVSMGGYVALALAERHPGFVVGLGLVDTRTTPDTPQAKERRLRLAKKMEMDQTLDPMLVEPARLLGETTKSERRHLLPTIDAWVHAQAPRGLAWAQRLMAHRPDRTEVLRAFAGPVAVVVGDEDTVTPLIEAQHMVDVAADVELTIIERSGHLSPIEHPQAVADALAALHHRATHRAAHNASATRKR
jgi:pimeloyl-ACP methyl ester carboxylesterase